MTSTDDYIITASGPTMYLTSLNGEITSHTFPSDIIHISPSPLLILADLMYSFDLERGESDVVGGYGGKGRGCTGNVGKGMVVAWGDGVEVYDIMDDDDDEMEE